ncbi:MAG: glutaredoxin family protein [Proteobacteria bacterium]|nr:glutaredoxin family protein [Pseudomonadota bacterium]
MILYSRQDCPLCEEVEENLIRLNLPYEFIDIDLDENLRKSYHVKIPILVNDSQQQLCWPFTQQELLEFAVST